MVTLRKKREDRVGNAFLVGIVLFLGYGIQDARHIDWDEKWQQTVRTLQTQNKPLQAEHFERLGPDSFRFRFCVRKTYFVPACFLAMAGHMIMVLMQTFIPAGVLIYRVVITTSRVLPFVLLVVFLYAWSPWINVPCAVEGALSAPPRGAGGAEMRLHLGIAWAARSLPHALWVGWWTYVVATWILPIPSVSRVARFFLAKSVVEHQKVHGSVY